jgi:hypothetical protein
MDIVIVVLPHTPQSLEQYRDYLSQALRHAEQDAKS